MSIPGKCKVLVVGGGPGGSYCAAALAREGIDTVLLEGTKFPRYHVGESMLPLMRHFLRYIDLDTTFNQYGFTKKVGAAFKLNPRKRDGYTDFLAAGGAQSHAWNVVRSEADNLMFQHAGKCGAQIFDQVQVQSIKFDSDSGIDARSELGRPVSAVYIRKGDSIHGEITFDYLIDASGRAGILSTKYLKNRRYNQELKNIASWGYWRRTSSYAKGTPRENSPFFEALQDESGWAWFIPLHDGTTSVGVVMNQDFATEKKARCGYSDAESLYRSNLGEAPDILKLLTDDGELVSDIKMASDYSYNATSYAIPFARIVGDAGCFIDPYFSSGVHLALLGGLSAATTVSAAIRGDCKEEIAMNWHSRKITDSYARFLLVVMSAYRQIRSQNDPMLSEPSEDNFDRAFELFRPVIQGSTDTNGNSPSRAELHEMLEFCAHAFEPVKPEDRASLLQKMSSGIKNWVISQKQPLSDDRQLDLSPGQLAALNHILARQVMRTEDTITINSFWTDAIDGLVPCLKRGNLGLMAA